MRFRHFLLLVLVLASLSVSTPRGDVQTDSGHAGLGLMLRRLGTTGTFMMATAHPDDENNGLLVMLARGQGVRTVLASATRGDGGQNEIGPELSDALAVLRTEELLAMHRYDGAEQYFTRAVDFGYSFSIEETFEKWGREEILGDFVRLIRTIRPDVMSGLRPDGQGGGQHHQASAVLAREAVTAAGDPKRFPEQIDEGLRPWQPAKFYFTATFGFRGEPPPPADQKLVAIDLAAYDPLLGRTYAELGSVARSMHKCQGMAQLLALPGPAVTRYRLVETTMPGQTEKDETSLFDGVDTTIEGLARYSGATPPDRLKTGLAAIARNIEQAQRGFESGRDVEILPSLLTALDDTRALRTSLARWGLPETAMFEIDFRLMRKEEDLQRAIVLAQSLRLESLADDGVVTAGQAIKISTIVANRGGGNVTVGRVTLSGVDVAASGCEPAPITAGGVFTCASAVRIPADARITSAYWTRLPDATRYRFDPDVPFGAPFRLTPFRARVELEIGGRHIVEELPVQFRYQGSIFSGEKRMELKVVPAFAVAVTPEVTIFPVSAAKPAVTSTHETMAQGTARGEEREVRVTVTNSAKGAASGEVVLNVPAGWQTTPHSVPVAFAREDEAQTVRFALRPIGVPPPGQHIVGARVRSGGAQYAAGYQVVEYPHTQRRHLRHAAQTVLKAIDVKVAPGLLVGYIAGVGDQVPEAIAQLGARVEPIVGDDLAWGDLARYDTIVTGVRAYERRADLRANNARLLKYAENGGVVIVQYNKFEFNEAQYGPYPAKVTSNRVTDEHASVELLVPGHPVFNAPNKIGAAAWDNWVQERGLYFLGEKDPRYVDLVRMSDPFPLNTGEKLGALVEAPIGQGRWIYLGLGLWRQLPAGVEGAYRLLANLLSLGDRSSRPRKGPTNGDSGLGIRDWFSPIYLHLSSVGKDRIYRWGCGPWGTV